MHRSYLELGPFDLLLVRGPDSRRFLQGQVSCDMNLLSPDLSLSGALCNIKGRVITDFLAFDQGGDCCLALTPGMGQVMQSVLSKYIVFFKASVESADDRYRRFGLLGNDAHHVLSTVLGRCPMSDYGTVSEDGIVVIKLPGLIPRFEIWIDRQAVSGRAESLLDAMKTQCAPGTDTSWQVEAFNAGIVHIRREMSEQYLPQELNYDISGVINFKKGCYTGQEIVARMYYRGTAKKRLFHLRCESTLQPQPLHVYQQADENTPAPTGLPVVNSLVTDNGETHLMAILPVETVNGGGKFFADAAARETPLEVLPLPYIGRDRD